MPTPTPSTSPTTPTTPDRAPNASDTPAVGAERPPMEVPDRPARPFAGGTSLDIAPALDNWPCGADELSARLIIGNDGRQKVQMRVDLGVLQMEIEGRPDGGRPILDDLRDALVQHKSLHRHDFGFTIIEDIADRLEREGKLYARRYLAWFVLGEWERSARDARHHLAILTMLEQYAERPEPAATWLPYALMMAARSDAAVFANRGDAHTAVRRIMSAQRRLKRHYRRHGGKAAYQRSEEIRVLKTVLKQLRRGLPTCPIRELRRELRRAVATESYERAAELRDRIDRLQRTAAA